MQDMIIQTAWLAGSLSPWHGVFSGCRQRRQPRDMAGNCETDKLEGCCKI